MRSNIIHNPVVVARQSLRGPCVRRVCGLQRRSGFATVSERPPRVAVVGAGPAGLVLARLLQRNAIPTTVFELDKDRHARTQGGSLDLHEGSAQRALKEAGLYEDFLKHARPEGETLRIYDPYDKALLDESKDASEGRPEEMHGRPEIDRVLLRNMLLDSLERDSVQWGHKLIRVERHVDDESHELIFDKHDTEKFDLVVGADGTWSRVRPLVTDAVPAFSGITGIDVHITNPEVRRPKLAERVGKGMCLTLGPDKGILCQRNGDGAIRVYALMRDAASWHKDCGIDWNDAEAAKSTFASRYFGNWSQTAKNLIVESDSDVVPRPIYMLPIGLRWQHRPGVTLIGDAAHVMSPFAGVGVNVAMEDALELAQHIINRGTQKNLATAVSAYEDAMFDRAEKYANQSWMFLNLFFHKRGGEAMMEHFAKVRSEEQTAAAAAVPASLDGSQATV